MTVLELALAYIRAGLSVVPVTRKDFDAWSEESKGFSYPWKQYQTAVMSETVAAREFKSAPGLAVICGEVSGTMEEFGEPVAGLTVIDFDVATLYPLWADTCEAAGVAVREFPTVKTRSGGFHVYVRSVLCEGNQKLCMVDRGGSGIEVGIETRGEGGLVFAPPTPGYEWITGGIDCVPILSAEDMGLLLSVARSMDKTGPLEPYKPSKVYGEGKLGDRPGDVFNKNADWRELLEADGALWLFHHGKRDHYRRPGKSDRTTGATTGNGHDGQDLLRVHSSNWPGVQPGCYSKFAYWAITRHGGDWKAATKAAAELYNVKRSVSVPAAPDPSEVHAVGMALVGDLSPKERVLIDADTLKADRVLAEFIYEQRRGTFLWCEAWQSWVVWTGMKWERTPSIFGLVGDIVDGLDAAQDAELIAILSATRRINGAIPWLKAFPGVSVDPNEFDSDPDILNTLSGIVDLRTGAIRPHDPEARCTMLAPTEVASEATHGKFSDFIAEICLGREDLAKALIVWLGYSITGRVSAQRWCIGVGGGRNGKSTLVDLLRQVLGPYAAIMPTQLLLSSRFEKPTHELEALRGARFVAAEEPDHRRHLDREFIKQITGGQAMRVRALYGKPYEMPITGKLFLATNHKPQVDADFAFWRRCMMVPFDYQVPEDQVNPALISELASERAEVMAWLVEGAIEFYRNGLRITEDMSQEIEDYKAENDDLGEFLEEKVEILSKDFSIHKTKLLAAYNSWAKANGLAEMDIKEMQSKMRQKGYKLETNAAKTARGFYRGLGLVEMAEDVRHDVRRDRE